MFLLDVINPLVVIGGVGIALVLGATAIAAIVALLILVWKKM